MRTTLRTVNVMAIVWLLVSACSTPSKIEVTPDDVVMEKAGKTVMLSAKVLDQNGNEMSTRGLTLNWYCEDTDVVKLTQDGVVTSVASGSADISVEVVDTGVKARVTVDVRIPATVRVSIDKIRLWEGETKDDVWAEVLTERGAVIPGLKPSFTVENSSILKIEPVLDPNKPRSWAKLTGLMSGATRVTARYDKFFTDIRVTVFAEDEEVQMVGNGISAKKARDARRGKKKKEKALKYDF